MNFEKNANVVKLKTFVQAFIVNLHCINNAVIGKEMQCTIKYKQLHKSVQTESEVQLK